MAESTFTFRVDQDLKATFADVATAQDRTAAQLLRVLMREAIERWRTSEEHDSWFRDEVERGIGEADNPETERIPHERVRSSWRQQRADLERQAAGRTA